MGTIKDRNGKDLTEAEDIKKRWQEYMVELYKKGLNDPDNSDAVILVFNVECQASFIFFPTLLFHPHQEAL